MALAVGLLIGMERERSHARELPAGSRTFALLALVGAVAESLDPPLALGGLVIVGALMIVAYFRTSDEDPGTTTVIAAVAAYLLGALAYSRPAVAVAVAVIVTTLLWSKTRIHRFVRQILTEVEVEDAIKFFVVAFVVLPLLPDRDLGPYGQLNPEKLWLLVVLLTGIGWVGYIGVRALGPERGLLVTGLAGGFVSATATTATMGRLARSGTGVRAPLAGALLASLATLIQLPIVLAVVNLDLLRRLVPAVLAAAFVLVGVAAAVYWGAVRARQRDGADGDPVDAPPAGRPFALWPAVLLAAVLTVALLVGRWGADLLGPSGAVLAAGVAGLADAHAGAIAAAGLAASGAIDTGTALVAIAAALGSNLLVKTVLAVTAGGRRFGLGFAAGMAVPAVVFGGVLASTVAGL